MATGNAIKRELGRLITLYRHSLTPAEFAVISDAWAEDFADVSDALFIAAAKAYRRAHSFFPAGSKAMLEICGNLREAELERRRRELRALPCDETPPDSEVVSLIIAECARIIDVGTRLCGGKK